VAMWSLPVRHLVFDSSGARCADCIRLLPRLGPDDVSFGWRCIDYLWKGFHSARLASLPRLVSVDRPLIGKPIVYGDRDLVLGLAREIFIVAPAGMLLVVHLAVINCKSN
jgi:hypothetical protein